MTVFWNREALRRTGYSEQQLTNLLALSANVEHELMYPTKQAVREAWERHQEPVQLTSPRILYTRTEIDRYAELAKKLGY